MIRNPIRLLARISIPLMFGIAAFAQLPSAATLKGSYYVRYLGEDTRNAGAMSFSGTMVFDGAGGYTLTGTGASSKATDKLLKTLAAGKYTVLSNGMIAIDNPFDTAATSASGPLFGGLGNGIIVASATEGAFCDLLVAIPVSTANSAANLTGTYNVASMEFLNGSLTATRNTFFPVTADGKGGFGDVTVRGTAQSLNDAQTAQTSAAATYTMTANGTGTLVLPAPVGTTAGNVLLSGSKVLYAAADGSFFIAGGATGYDLIVGAKAAPGVTPDGLYFSGYLENYAVGSDVDAVYSVSGSTNAIGALKAVIAHERTNSELFFPYDFTYSDPFTFAANGVSSDGLSAVGAGGNLVIGTSSAGDYRIVIRAKSVPMTASGTIFLNPQGIVNAANNVPMTAQYSPGEVVTLYGSAFTTQTATASAPFPASLGGVTVNISFTDSSGKAVATTAPVYFVSPGQVSAVIPFNAPTNGSLLTFSVSNGATKSNDVSVYSGPASPGIFTVPTGGIGSGAILHPDFTLVSAASPAKSGETIQIYLTGLGAVSGTTAAGAPGPSTTLASTILPIDVAVIDANGSGHSGKVTFSGLAPGLGGLYQVNVTLPTGLPAGSLTISVYAGDGSDFGDGWNIQATVPVTK
jgi:uncharacterized protein (TIGR03437 family)